MTSPRDLVVTRRGLRVMGRVLPCSIGRGAVRTDKHEGDGATPAGHLHVTGLLYRPDRLVAPCAWARPIGPRDLWSDDPADSRYNHLVQAPYRHGHERLRRADPLYDLVLLTDWNWPDAVPGRGSAIFVHQWRRPGYPTEGCIALSRKNLLWLVRRAPPGTRLIVPKTLTA